MKNVYGYIRVSTKEQVEGASLPEQKYAIKEFAKKNNLNIIHFYEETKTAAKKGRPFFLEMIENLHQGKASGVIIHKIDRSARNLHDWASIGDLIDRGIEVFFAHESLNMNERGGRLSADIQAVMASDYVRNLRQETVKGLYGRLKQGVFPWGAPIGYDNNGKGKLKTINPKQSKLVKEVFELYVTETYNIIDLSKEMEKRGLLNHRGNRVCKNGIVRIIKNPFYIGLMSAKGKIFKGNHKKIIDTRLYEQAQVILIGRNKKKGLKHNYLFNRQMRCENCKYMMIGERQKGNVYYRCQTRKCPTKSIREDTIEYYVKNVLKTIQMTGKEILTLEGFIQESKNSAVETQQEILNGFDMQIKKLENKEEKLLDAYLENVIDKKEYEKRKQKNLLNQVELEEKRSTVSDSKTSIFENIERFLELCKSPLKLYVSGIQEEKRELIKIITSNLTINRRKAIFTMISPYSELANRDIFSLCALDRDTHRTLTPKIIYSDKNTSPIIPKPLNRKQLKEFFNFLLKTATSLYIPNINEYNHEISENDTRS